MTFSSRLYTEVIIRDIWRVRIKYGDYRVGNMSWVSSLLSAVGEGGTTDNKTAETEAGRGETTGRAFIDSLIDGIQTPALLVDSNGAIVTINDQALELFETDRTAVHGHRPAALTDCDTEDLINSVLKKEATKSDQRQQIQINNEDYIISRTTVPLFDDNGALRGAVQLIRDVTEDARRQRQLDALEAYENLVLTDLKEKLDDLAAGDLTFSTEVPEPEADFDAIQTVYEDFKEMNHALERTIADLRDMMITIEKQSDALEQKSHSLERNTDQIASTIEEINASTHEMADGADDLAEQTDAVDQAVGQLSASIEEISATAQEIDEESEYAGDIAQEGVEEASMAVREILAATETTEQITQDMRQLESRMEEIDEILDVITDIADQTNLLALNANIEAARADQGGDGFGVVADEVKSLAEQSQQQAQEIEEIVHGVKEQTDAVAEGLNDANDAIQEGATAVETVVERLDDIEQAVQSTSQGATEVSEAVEQQAVNADEVSRLVDETAALSEQISASIQQITAGIDQQTQAIDETDDLADRLARSSEQLHGNIAEFELNSESEPETESSREVLTQ